MKDDAAVHIRIASDARLLPVVRGAAERLAQAECFCKEEVHEFVWAIDEALANVIKHGYAGRSDQPIEVAFRRAATPDGRQGLEVVIRDRGRQVEPEEIRCRSLEDVRPGGLGVHVIRTVMDEADYSRLADGGMQLRMVKYRRTPGQAGDASRVPAAAGGHEAK